MRDADVMLGRLKKAAAALDPQDWAPADSIRSRLGRQRAVQRRALDTEYRSEGYVVLLDRLVDAARAPKFAEGADVSAAEALPGLVQRPWDHLTKAVAQLEDDPSYEHLHEIRIRAKRVRYAAEAATLALPEAQTMATTAAAVQEVLGEQHDAIVAARWLRDIAATNVTRAEAMVCGLLIAAEERDAAAWGEKWPDAWDAASKRKVRKWLG